MKKQFIQYCLLFSIILLAWQQTQAQGTNCATATSFCSNGLDPYPAGVNNPAAPIGNNYDCLFTQPNPAWFYLDINQSGSLDFTLDNTGGEDIDFILYGPFPNLAAAISQCGNLGNGGPSGGVVDCSYSAASVETVSVPNAIAGEVYVLLITNFSNQPTNIFATPNSGTGNYTCDCQTTVHYGLAPVGFNDAALVDTTEYDADFVVCAGGQVGFTIDVQADSIVDSIGIYFPNTNLGAIFGPANVTVFGPSYPIPGRYDTANFVVFIQTDSTLIGDNNGIFSILNSNCVQDLNIRIRVVGLDAIAQDTSICAGVAQDVQLFGNSFATSGGTYQWTQLSGPPITFNDNTLQNPIVSIPAGTVAGSSVVLQASFASTPDSILPVSCTSTDEVTIHFINGALDVLATASDYSLCQNGLPNTLQLTSMVSGFGVDSSTATYTWTSIPAAAVGMLSASNVASPTGNIVGNPSDVIQYIIDADFGACSGSDTITLNFGTWVADVTPATDTVCPGDNVPLAASPGSSSCAPVYAVSSIPYAPVAGTGTVVNLGDEIVSPPLNIPFSFEFFCNAYNQLVISPNGFLSFDLGSSSHFLNAAIPNAAIPQNFIALAWDDLDPDNGAAGTIEYFTVGTAPNRRFVVNFINVPHYPGGAGAPTVTVQAILYEGTNIIEIHNTNVQNDGGGMTQGIENANGTIGYPIPGSNDVPFTAVNTAYRFVPQVTFLPTYNWAPTPTLSSTNTQNTIATPNSNTTYYVSITEGGCTMVDSAIIVLSSPLAAPVLACDSVGSNFVAFGWAAIPGAASYEYSLDSGATWISTTDLFFIQTGMTAGSSQTIFVRGIAAAGACTTGPSIGQTCTTTVSCIFPAPVVSCDSTTITSVAFSWNTLSSADLGYEYSTDGGVTWISTTDTFIIFAGLANNTTVDILVQGISSDTACTPSLVGTQSCATDNCNNPSANVQRFENTLCVGSNSYVLVVGFGSGTLPFAFDLGNGLVDTAYAVGDILFQGIAPGNYQATLTDLVSGCSSSGTVDIEIADSSKNVTINIAQTASISCGDTSGAALTVNVSSGAPSSYLWNTGETTSAITGLTAGNYNVTATDATGTCSDDASFTVSGPSAPNLAAWVGAIGQDSTCILQGETIDIDAGANETGVTYLWSPATDVANVNSPATTIVGTTVGTTVYTITAVNADSCITTDQIVLCVEPVGFRGIPTAFTPNGDGNNDTFKPVMEGGTATRFEIYNRWGQKIFADADAATGSGWDGTKGGVEQPRDVYMYILEYEFPGDATPTLLRGVVTLIR